MKTIFFLFLGILILASCNRSDYVKNSMSGSELTELSDYEKDSLFIVSSLKVFVEGVEEENTEKVLSIYHSDYVYTYPTRQRAVAEIKKEYEKAFDNKELFVSYPRFEVAEIKIIDQLAYAVVNWNFTISLQENERVLRNRFYRDIQIWQKQVDGGWLMIRSWQYPIPL